MKPTVLALADGTLFEGRSFGSDQETVGEVVFNTSIFGYQEILTDPSYVGQIVTMAYPQMGNVGTNSADEESARPHAVGMVVKEVSRPSNWRSEGSLDDYLQRWKVAGIEGLDTRRLVRHLRIHGSQMGVLSAEKVSAKALVDRARSAPGMEGLDLATGVSTTKVYEWTTPTPDVLSMGAPPPAPARFKVVAVDYGLKKAMLQFLVDVGCQVTVVPTTPSRTSRRRRSRSPRRTTASPSTPRASVSAPWSRTST